MIWSTTCLCASKSQREMRYAKRTIKRRTNSVGIIPNDIAIIRLVGSQLLEQQVEKWQLEGRRFFSVAIMAKIPQPEVLIDLTLLVIRHSRQH